VVAPWTDLLEAVRDGRATGRAPASVARDPRRALQDHHHPDDLRLGAIAAGPTALVTIVLSAQAGTSSMVPSLATATGLRNIVANTGFAMLTAAVFGATVSGGEFRHKTITDTYLDQPGRAWSRSGSSCRTDRRLPYLIRSPTAALFQRAQGLGERPLQPGEVVGLAVMVRRELVGPSDRGVPYVFAGTLDEGPDVAEAFGVGHRPVAAAGDVDRRGVRENPAAPFIEVVIDTERSAGYP
jgi:hypothetical protein